MLTAITYLTKKDGKFHQTRERMINIRKIMDIEITEKMA